MGNRGYDAIVVGGGHNGLVCAFYLARAGRRVLVLERRPFVGGACVTEEIFPGYRISTCSYVMWKLEQKIRDDMRLDARGLRCHLVDPAIFFPYEDGAHAVFRVDTKKTQESIARFNKRDAARYPDWLAFWERATGLIQPFLLRDPPSLSEVWALARKKGDEKVLERLLTGSTADLTSEYFEDPRVRAMVVYVQDLADPYAPGSAWAEAYFQFGASGSHGFYVVEGGMGSITRTMAEAAREAGADIRTDAPVARVLLRGGKACGVRLESGEEIPAGIVVSNADPKRTYRTLFGPNNLSAGFRARVERLKTNTGYFKFHCVMSNPPDVSRYLGRPMRPKEASYILIAPSLDHYARAAAAMRCGELPAEPICHLQIPTDYDRTLTSKDGHICSIWGLYVPPKLARGTWPERREEFGNRVIDYVTRFIPNFRSDIRAWMMMTPHDIEERIGITDGAIRHLDIVPGQFLDQRPFPGMSYDTPVPNFYLCGSGTHPAGEVTGAPGYNAARFILRQGRGRPRPARRPVSGAGSRRAGRGASSKKRRAPARRKGMRVRR